MCEIAYQHVHLLWSIVISYIAYRFNIKLYYIVGLTTGIIIEMMQYFAKCESLKIGDRLMDLSFWALGGILIYFYVKKTNLNK